jgi:hypothetical protein
LVPNQEPRWLKRVERQIIASTSQLIQTTLIDAKRAILHKQS